jgi:hypothetical protein
VTLVKQQAPAWFGYRAKLVIVDGPLAGCPVISAAAGQPGARRSRANGQVSMTRNVINSGIFAYRLGLLTADIYPERHQISDYCVKTRLSCGSILWMKRSRGIANGEPVTTYGSFHPQRFLVVPAGGSQPGACTMRLDEPKSTDGRNRNEY